MTSNDDYLHKDDPIDGPKYCLISLLHKESLINSKIIGIKVKGSYATMSKAEEQIKEFHKTYPNLNIYCVEVGLWKYIDIKDPSVISTDNIDKMNRLMKKIGGEPVIKNDNIKPDIRTIESNETMTEPSSYATLLMPSDVHVPPDLQIFFDGLTTRDARERLGRLSLKAGQPLHIGLPPPNDHAKLVFLPYGCDFDHILLSGLKLNRRVEGHKHVKDGLEYRSPDDKWLVHLHFSDEACTGEGIVQLAIYHDGVRFPYNGLSRYGITL